MTNQRKPEALEQHRLKAHQFARLHREGGLFQMPSVTSQSIAEQYTARGVPAVNIEVGPGVLSAAVETVSEIIVATNTLVNLDIAPSLVPSASAVADILRPFIGAGAVGVTLRDSENGGNLLDVDVAVEIIRTARRTADAARLPFVVTAHTAETAADRTTRAIAYRQAGADCIAVTLQPGQQIEPRFVQEIRAPLAVIVQQLNQEFADGLAQAGVRRMTWPAG